jgi:transposase
MTKKRKNKYNHYTEDFRREAVRRSEDPHTSAVEVANKLKGSEPFSVCQ